MAKIKLTKSAGPHGGRSSAQGGRAGSKPAPFHHRRPASRRCDGMAGGHHSASPASILATLLRQLAGPPPAGRPHDAICPPPVREFGASDIKRLREALKFSQPVFALHLHTSASTVRKWEQGETHPTGPALKLLNIIARVCRPSSDARMDGDQTVQILVSLIREFRAAPPTSIHASRRTAVGFAGCARYFVPNHGHPALAPDAFGPCGPARFACPKRECAVGCKRRWI